MNRYDVRLFRSLDRGRLLRRQSNCLKQIAPYALKLPYSAARRGSMIAIRGFTPPGNPFDDVTTGLDSLLRTSTRSSGLLARSGRSDLRHHPPLLCPAD